MSNNLFPWWLPYYKKEDQTNFGNGHIGLKAKPQAVRVLWKQQKSRDRPEGKNRAAGLATEARAQMATRPSGRECKR